MENSGVMFPRVKFIFPQLTYNIYTSLQGIVFQVRNWNNKGTREGSQSIPYSIREHVATVNLCLVNTQDITACTELISDGTVYVKETMCLFCFTENSVTKGIFKSPFFSL
jgi:hypothetical protein